MLSSSAALAWNSTFLPASDAGHYSERATVRLGEETWQLPDISYAGYRLSQQPLGHGVPCRIVDVAAEPGADISAAVQAAINKAGAAGGGVVRIPAGQFTVGQSIAIAHDHVSVEGAGSARTVLRVPASYSSESSLGDGGLFTIGPEPGEWRRGWWSRSKQLTEVTQALAAQSRSMLVADAGRLTVGQAVVVVQNAWQGLSQQHSAQQWAWVDGEDAEARHDRQFAFVYLRDIVRIDGNSVILDAPIPVALDPANNPISVRDPDDPAWTAPRRNSGVAGLRMRFDDNRNGEDSRPFGVGVLVDAMRDAWVHDVQIENFPRHGVLVTHSARVTVSQSKAADMQDDGSGGYGYGFTAFSSQNVLFLSNYAEETRHGFMAQRMASSNIVFSNNRSYAARAGGDGTHHGIAQQVSFDHHQLGYGTGLRMMYRGPKSGHAQETIHGGVVWNLRSDGRPGGYYGGALLMNPAAGSQNFVIGVAGLPVFDLGLTRANGNPRNLQRIRPAQGLRRLERAEQNQPGAANGNVAYEGVGLAGLQPQSLFAAQLKARSGQAVPPFSGGCGVTPDRAAVVPRIDAANHQLIFDSDHLGYTPLVSPKCPRCRTDAAAPDAVGGESLMLDLAPDNWSAGVHFRGAWVPVDAVDAVRLRVRAGRPGQAVRLTLGALHLEQWEPERAHGTTHVVLDSLPANRWTSIRVPAGQINGPAFNTISFSSVGEPSGGQIHVDDIVVLPRK